MSLDVNGVRIFILQDRSSSTVERLGDLASHLGSRAVFCMEAAMPWSDLPDPNPPPKTRGEWLGAILARCVLVFISLMILGLCATNWFPVSAVEF